MMEITWCMRPFNSDFGPFGRANYSMLTWNPAFKEERERKWDEQHEEYLARISGGPPDPSDGYKAGLESGMGSWDYDNDYDRTRTIATYGHDGQGHDNDR